MSQFKIEIKNNGIELGSEMIKLDEIFLNKGLNPSAQAVASFKYRTALQVGGNPVILRIWKKDGDYYWNLKKTRKLDNALTETNPLQILMDRERCLVKKAGGQYNQRAMIDVYSSNPEKNKYYLYSIAKVEALHKKREVNEVATMVYGIKRFAERESLTRYLDNIGLPFYKIKDVRANAARGEFFSHSYMVNGKNGTLTKDQIADRKSSLKEHRQCLEGLLLLIAAEYTHQDIKSDNIVRNENGYFLIDLGLGDSRSQQELNESENVVNARRGTPIYQHPRLMINTGIGINRARGDIYGLCFAFIAKYILIERSWCDNINQILTYLTTSAELNKNKVLHGIALDYPNDPAMQKGLKAMLEVCHGAWVSFGRDIREKSVSELIRNLSIAFEVVDATLVRVAINKAGESQELRDQAIEGYLQDKQGMIFLNLSPQDQLCQLLSQNPIQEERVVALINSAGSQVLSFPSDLEYMNICSRAMFVAVFQNKGNLYDALTGNKTRVELTELVKATLATVTNDNKQLVMEFVLRKELDKTPQQGFSTQTIARLMEFYPQFNLNALLYGQTFGQKIMRAALERGNKALYDKLTEKGATLTSLLSIIPSSDVNTKNDLISRRLSLLMNHSPLTYAEAQEACQLAINTPECFAAFKLKKIDLSTFKQLLTEDMVFTGDRSTQDMIDFLAALEQAPVQALLNGNVAEQLVQQCLDACKNGPANQHKINQLAPLFFDKINVLIDCHKDAAGNRDVNLSVFLTDMLHVSYKKNHLSRAQFAQSLGLLQAPEDQIDTSNFFENELIKQSSQILLNENIVREFDNESINELPRVQPEELEALREKAQLLYQDTIPTNKEELIKIGLQLIKNDPDLYAHQNNLPIYEAPQVEHVASALELFLDINSREGIARFVQENHIARKNLLNAGWLAYTKTQKIESLETIVILFDEYKYTQHDYFYKGLVQFADISEDKVQEIRKNYNRFANFIAYSPEKMTQLLTTELTQGAEAAAEEALRFDSEEQQQRIAEQQRVAEQQRIDQQEADITNILNELQNRVGRIEQHNFPEAVDVATELLRDLAIYRDNYIASLRGQPSIAEQTAAEEQYKLGCKIAIDKVKPILEKDLGWKDYLKNLLTKLVNAIIWTSTMGNSNSFFPYKKSASLEAIEEAEENFGSWRLRVEG